MEHCKETIKTLAQKWLNENDFCDYPFVADMLQAIVDDEVDLEGAQDMVDEYITEEDEFLLGPINLAYKVQEQEAAQRYLYKLQNEPIQLTLDLVYDETPNDTQPF